MTRATDAATASALPDDLLRDIFARVADPVDLLRCAGTCRRWLSLIGDPAFLRRAGGLLPETGRRASFLLGAFCQEAALASALKPMKKESTWPPQFLRLHAPPAGGGRPSFLPNDDGLFNYAKPLASRHGLLLVRIMPTPLDRQKLHLAVCHPVIGERTTRLVPPPPVDLDPQLFGADITGYALVTAADHGTPDHLDKHGQPAFQVLLTVTAVQSDDQSVYAYSYSSARDSWSAPIKCLQVSGLTMSGPRAGTVAHGVVHWLYRDKTNFYTLDISLDSTALTASLTRIGIQVECDLPPFPCIVGGTLSFVNKRNTGMLELWTKGEQDGDHGCGGSGGWLCSELKFEEANEITMFAFLESKGAMLVHNGNCLLTVDLENKEVEPLRGHGSLRSYTARELCGWVRCQGRNSCGDCTYNKLVAYEMNWPSYILHLCSRRLEAHETKDSRM